MTENHGLSKCTRAHSKQAGDANRMGEMKATVENMHILVDQVVDLLQTM